MYPGPDSDWLANPLMKLLLRKKQDATQCSQTFIYLAIYAIIS